MFFQALGTFWKDDEKRVFEVEADFNGATFSGEANFRDTKFLKHTKLNGNKFSSINFGGTSFPENESIISREWGVEQEVSFNLIVYLAFNQENSP